MAKGTLVKYRTQGNAVLERIKNQPLPASVKPALKRFQQSHAQYLVTADAADAARAARDASLQLVADADTVLDSSLETLAQKAAGAGLGTRQSPLASFTKIRVSDLAALPYKKEADTVIALGAKIAKSDAPKDVVSAAAACVKNAKSVQTKLTALIKPQAAYDKAMRARDALLPEWTKAYNSLKKQAAAAWDEDEATFESVFAPVESIQAPKQKRAKKPSPPKPPPPNADA